MLKKAIAEKRGSRVQWVEVLFCLGVLQKRLLNRMLYSFLLHPTAPLGLLLSVVTKVTKNTLFSTPHLEPEIRFCGGKI